MDFQCWGLSHKSTSLEVREKFAFNKEEIDEILVNLKEKMPFETGVFVSTCNRTEFYTFCSRAEIKNFDRNLKEAANRKITIRKNDQYLYSGIDAFKHLLKVMTGIDSMIVGEPDIFGQVKKSFQNSKAHMYLNKSMEEMFMGAVKLSKKIRTSAKLSKNPISIASLVDNKLDSPCKEVMIIGAGDVSQALVTRFIKKGLKISLFNRSKVKISNLASKSLTSIKKNIHLVGAIVIAAPADEPFFNAKDLANCKQRLQVFDLAIPRNINYSVKSAHIELLNLDQLSETIASNLHSRQAAVTEAETFIDESIDHEYSKICGLSKLKSKQKDIKEKLKEVKDDALASAKSKFKSGADYERVLEDLANEINAKDLFHISKALEKTIQNSSKGK